MYIEIEGNSYFIHPKTDIDIIGIKNIEDNIVHLNVPSHLPQDSLVTFIKTQLPKQISKYQNSDVYGIEAIKVFDQSYAIKFLDTQSPYISKGIIYSSKRSVSSKLGIERLQQHLLLNHINSVMSTLEEELNKILPKINLKKLKTKLYSNCPNRQSITYSKALSEKSIDFITYIIILSVGEFLKYKEEELCYLLNKYVSDWKRCERVFKYEQQ